MKKKTSIKPTPEAPPVAPVAVSRASRRTPAGTAKKSVRPSGSGQRAALAAILADSSIPAVTPVQGLIKLDLNGLTATTLAPYLKMVRDGMKGNLYYAEDEAEVVILDAAYQALISDMEIATGLENELKSVRSRVDQSITQGKDVLRGIARYCEAWDSSDEALGSVGWTRRRTPGPAKPMPVPSGLVMQPGSNPGQVRARWNAVPNRYFYDIQVFNSAGQPNPVPWDSVPSTQDIRVIQLFSGYPSGSFLTVRIRANGSKGAGPWCDPLTARVP